MPGNYEARGDRRQAAAAPSTWCLILCRATMKLGATAGKPRPPPRLGASKRKSYKNPMKFPALALLLPFLLTSPVLAQEAALPLEPPTLRLDLAAGSLPPLAEDRKSTRLNSSH